MIAREYKIVKTKLASVITWAAETDILTSRLAQNNRASANVYVHGHHPKKNLFRPEDYGVQYIAQRDAPPKLKTALALAITEGSLDPIAIITPDALFNEDIAHYFEYLVAHKLGRAYGSYVSSPSGSVSCVIISGDLVERANKDCPGDLPIYAGIDWLHAFGNRFVRSPRYFDATDLNLVSHYSVPSIVEEAVVPEISTPPAKKKSGRPKGSKSYAR